MLTIHSGGAEGADMYFGNIGTELGYKVIHHSFDGHRINGSGEQIVHNLFQLLLADIHLKKANELLCRTFPPRSGFVKRLLQRNYYQVKDSQYIIAISKLEKNLKSVRGGTAWAVQMGIDFDKKVYVYDDGQTNKWHSYERSMGVFVPLQSIPAVNGSFAGIGTREITASGIKAIREFLVYNTENNNILKIWTGQYRYSGIDRFDITVKGGVNKVFAPTWAMVNGIKNGTLSEKEYVKQYNDMLENSMTKCPQAWDELISLKEVTLVCFCAKNTFCHRYILTKFLMDKFKAKYMGER